MHLNPPNRNITWFIRLNRNEISVSQPLANFFSISLTIGSPSNLILKSVSLLVDHLKVSHTFHTNGSDLRIFKGDLIPATVTSKSNPQKHTWNLGPAPSPIFCAFNESELLATRIEAEAKKTTHVFFTTEFSPHKGLCPVLGEVGHSDSAKPLCNCDLKQTPK